MEKVVIGRAREEAPDSRKLPVMRTLARLHECDVQTLYGMVEGDELDVHDILTEMVYHREVEALKGSRGDRFTLTLKGWAEYMNVLGSIYELPE